MFDSILDCNDAYTLALLYFINVLATVVFCRSLSMYCVSRLEPWEV
jgi:hypothetical protein